MESLIANPTVVLTALGIFSVLVAGFLFQRMAKAPAQGEARVVELVNKLDAMARKLSEAEHIGKFGSFAWDFTDVSASFWSDEMFELCGLKPHPGKPPFVDTIVSTIHDKDRDEAKINWDKVLHQPGAFNFMFRTVALTGQVRYLRVQGTTTFGPSRTLKLIQGVAQDITKEVEVDKAKTEFVSLASHQLKTPLTAIKWISEALGSGSPGTLTPQQADYVHKLHDENQRMIDMVNDLLNVSRIELGTLALQLTDVDVLELMRGVIDEQQHTADEKKVSIKLTSSPSLPHLTAADRNLARMVLQNLLSNAIKYTPAGGQVSCDLSLSGVQREAVFVRVTDTGIGIPKTEQSRVFERLHRASNARNLVPDGTGLGLYLLKTIVDRAGGSVTFESIEGKGTTFYVSLPTIWQGTKEKAAA